jgi:protein-tyrosine sulfotransferase
MKARRGMPSPRRRDQALTAMSLAFLRRRHRNVDGKVPPPLFIIGSGRSGNTLVRRVLLASGAIYIPPETFVLGDIIEGWQRTALLGWRERVWLFCAHFEKHIHFPTFGLENLNNFAEEARTLPNEARDLKTLIEAFFRYLARDHGSSAIRWGDKTPYNTFHLAALEAVFPNAQYLWLVRDGRDVALSYVDAGLFDTLDAAADRWVAANRACAALAARNPGVYRQSYEALVSDPETHFRAIFKWAELPFSPEVLTAPTAPMGDVEALAHHRNVTQPILATSIGRWQSHLSADDLAQFSKEFWIMIEEFGYDQSGPDV